MIELESALLDDCTVNDIYAICRGKAIPEALRPDVWQICLDVRHKSDQMALFNEIYDLPFQNKLRDDCDNFVDKLGNDDEVKRFSLPVHLFLRACSVLGQSFRRFGLGVNSNVLL